MKLKFEILEAASLLLNMLDTCEDDEFVDYVVEAVYNNDRMALFELEDVL